MANETKKLEPIELSRLPVIENPSNYWIFGSKTEKDGTLISGRYLLDSLEEYARSLQLERRISFGMEAESLDMFIGEAMTIYKVEALNVAELSINGIVISNFDSDNLSISINKRSLVNFKIKFQSLDPRAYLFIYAKAKVV